MSDDGRKIDEIKVDWDTRLVIRYHAHAYEPTFTIEAGTERFTGNNLRLLIEQARVHCEGWSKLKWEPIIAVDTEIGYDMKLEFERLFTAKHKGRQVYRRWRIGEIDEPNFGSYNSNELRKTADTMTGEPGAVDRSKPRGRIMSFTPDRWNQLRKLRQMLDEATNAVREKLGKILDDATDAGLDTFLAQTASGGLPGLPFSK